MLIPKWRKWALEKLGVGDLILGVDLFATPWTTAAPLFITKEMDSFGFDWGALQASSSHLLWANPPFSALERVVEKLANEPCKVALVTPNWEDRNWWKALQALPHNKICLPPRHHLFYGGFKKTSLPQKSWRTVVWLVDTRQHAKGSQDPPSSGASTPEKKRGLTELREEMAKLPQVQWSHGFQGGKPTFVDAPDFSGPLPGMDDKQCQTDFFPGDALHPLPCHNSDVPTIVVTPPDSPPVAYLRGGIRTVGERHHPHGDPTGSLERYLKLAVTVTTSDGEKFQAKALVDTGAEVSLIKKDLVPEKFFTPAKNPLRLVAANNQKLSGGSLEVVAELQLQARNLENRDKLSIATPTSFYVADIEEDLILSFHWLAMRDMVVNPRQNGLSTTIGKIKLWIPGESAHLRQRANARLPWEPVSICAVPTAPIRTQKKRALDLFCGRKSATKVLMDHGYQVESLDIDPKRQPSICKNVLEWEYKKFPRGFFDIIVASPPCTEYSAAKTKGVRRDEELADPLVRKTLEIISYFQPPVWWLETPRNGRLTKKPFMQNLSHVDVDYCRFEDLGYKKPTRFYGGPHIRELQSILCDPLNCPGLVWDRIPSAAKPLRHRNHKGGGTGRVITEEACYIPPGVIEYVSGFSQGPPPSWTRIFPAQLCEEIRKPTKTEEHFLNVISDPKMAKAIEEVRAMQLSLQPKTSIIVGTPLPILDDETEWEIASRLAHTNVSIQEVKVEPPQPGEEFYFDLAQKLRQDLLNEFGDSSLSGKYPGGTTVRGPDGMAEIWLKPDARPVSIPPYRMGERREVLAELVSAAQACGKLEPGKGPWNTPCFPVPKKTPGTFRLVQDFRPQNAATIKDGHPLPLIGDIVQRQGQNLVWTTLDLVDGYHQMPMKPEHRHVTCMSTPHGTMQWTVQVMGLKNAGSQFQRMMEWVLQDHPTADAYIDDIIIGSTGKTLEEAMRNNYRETRDVLQTLKKQNMACKPKSDFFAREVTFCGHILREGRRSPAPGKLLPIQFWELPKTVTDLRGFLGLTNYFSEYVPHYASFAAPLSAKLKLNRQDGKKGSKLRLKWEPEEIEAFLALKKALTDQLELWQVNLDKPFRLHCDASDFAIGAELCQQFGERWLPVALFSRKLAKAQLNWVPLEKETYAIVAALRKWGGLIGFQPVVVTTDHKALENWVTEHVDTPSGPRGRRARWHETLSQFDITVVYVPGPDNVVADAMARWAYPASSARDDVSFHGSAEASEEVKKMVEEELAIAKTMAVMIRKTIPPSSQPTSSSSGRAQARQCLPASTVAPVGGAPEGDHPSPPRFYFAPRKPGGQPVMDPRLAMRRPPAKFAVKPAPAYPLPSWWEDAANVLYCDWGSQYWLCPTFSDIWANTQFWGPQWPKDYKVLNKKLFHVERLCVPKDRVVELIDSHHRWNAHQGEARLLPDLHLHYEFPNEVDVQKTLRKIKQSCLVCQQCEAPNFSLSGPISMTPVPPRVFTSISMDLFRMPEVEYQGETFDAFLLWVDRHSGWMVARPTLYEGCTGEKAAQLFFTSSWGEIGVPSIITCDLGSHFISGWWKTMCNRLGIRLAFSQAYRPQANGKAEVSGRVIKDMLRKLHIENKLGINWVEALPRVLRIQHDTIDPITGLSPYQIVFGRDRALAALPWEKFEEAPEASTFFNHIAEIDVEVADRLNKAHQKLAERINASRRPKPPFCVGDWIYLTKPNPWVV
jgi:hypothetical protein